MFFSVVIPVYNVEKYLRECVDSILTQSFTDFELILVNDGSTDGSPAICDAYAEADGRVKVIHNANGGASVARNAGLRAAQGTYVINIDSDDFFLSNDVFEKIHRATQGKDIVLYKYQKYFDGKKQPEACEFSYATLSATDDFATVIDKLVKTDAFFGMAWMKAVRRELIAENGIYFREGIVGEDIDWNYLLYSFAHSVTAIDESFVAYRQRENSVTSAVKIKSLDSLVYILEKWAELFKNLSDEKLKGVLLGSLAKHYSNTLIAYVRIRDKEKKKYIGRMKALSWLLDYGLSKRPRTVARIYRVLGFRLTVLAIQVLDKIK